MQQNVLFVRNDVLPSWWANAIQKALSTLASPNFRVGQVNATTVEVVAGADDDAVVLMIDGKWRWNEVTVQRAHPGGAAGAYKLWATSRANDIRAIPAPGSDFTNYAFDLAITSGAPPAIVAGTVDIFRPIADLTWDGAAITVIDPLLGGQPRAGSIINADIAPAAAIAMSKLQLAITDAQVVAGAAIAKSKLAALAIVNADIAVGAAIAQAKLALAITNAEVAGGAAIAEAKLALASDAAAGVASRRTLGAGATQAAPGTDARFPAGADIVNADVQQFGLNYDRIARDENGAAKGSFMATMNAGIGVSNGYSGPLAFGNQVYDIGGHYNPGASEFIAPARGIYHFATFVTWLDAWVDQTRMILNLYVNGVANKPLAQRRWSGGTDDQSVEGGTDFLLNAGDAVGIHLAIAGAGVNVKFSSNSWFCGHMVGLIT